MILILSYVRGSEERTLETWRSFGMLTMTAMRKTGII